MRSSMLEAFQLRLLMNLAIWILAWIYTIIDNVTFSSLTAIERSNAMPMSSKSLQFCCSKYNFPMIGYHHPTNAFVCWHSYWDAFLIINHYFEHVFISTTVQGLAMTEVVFFALNMQADSLEWVWCSSGRRCRLTVPLLTMLYHEMFDFTLPLLEFLCNVFLIGQYANILFWPLG